MQPRDQIKTGTISVFALIFLITGAIDSIRNLPSAALFGPSLISFFILAALFFLIPVGLVSAQLSSGASPRAGVYQWVKHGLNAPLGFVAIWLQWFNTLIWYPTILSFLAGTVTYLIDPQLAQNKIYLVSMILFTFWGLTLLNLRGIKTSARFATVCALLGMVVPMVGIIGLGAVWGFSGKLMAIHFSLQSILPDFHHGDSWISLTAIMASFLGMELSAVHIHEIKNPQRSFPLAMLISVLFILSTMILGALSIASVLPAKQINLVDGVMQALNQFLVSFHLTPLVPFAIMAIVIGGLGNMINWIIAPAKGLLQAANDGFLPNVLTKTNKHEVAHNVLLLQAIVVSAVCLMFLLMPSVNGSYWLLTDLSTQVYVLMYIVMFVAAIFLHLHQPDASQKFKIPGGAYGFYTVCLMGITGCLVTIIIGFFPPSGIDVGSSLHFDILIGTGMLFAVLPSLGFILWRYSTVTDLARLRG